MKTFDLRRENTTVDELLRWAVSDSVLIRSKEGREFILEDSDSFEREVAMLSKSDKFMDFLEGRSKEAGTVSLDEFEEGLKQ